MSYKVVEAVLENGPADLTETLVMVAIAENASDSGYAYPGIAKIAHRSRCCERHVIRILKKIAVDGWLVILPKAEGPGKKQTAYQLNLDKLSTPDSHAAQIALEKSRRIEKRGRKADSHAAQIALEKSGDISADSHVTFAPRSHDISPLPILKNHEPSIEPSLVLSLSPPGELILPPLAKKPTSKHVLFQQALARYYTNTARMQMPWGPAEGKQLKSLLDANPALSIADFEVILNHRAQSEVAHSKRPSAWLSQATDYLGGPLDRYGKPKHIGGDCGKPSKSERIIDSSRKALRILERSHVDLEANSDGRSAETGPTHRPRLESTSGQVVAADTGFDWGRAL